MDASETRAYIEHRLRHVGWHDSPHFDEAAFDAIHRWTAGIPRRINLLCNRLLLAAYLNGLESPADGKNIIRGLISRGYDDASISQIAGQNAIDLLRRTIG